MGFVDIALMLIGMVRRYDICASFMALSQFGVSLM
jgi:hypothetical protein